MVWSAAATTTKSKSFDGFRTVRSYRRRHDVHLGRHSRKDQNEEPARVRRRWVQGKNWLIEADQFDAEKAHKALGGQLLTS